MAALEGHDGPDVATSGNGEGRSSFDDRAPTSDLSAMHL
jgi:hypothetical protein